MVGGVVGRSVGEYSKQLPYSLAITHRSSGQRRFSWYAVFMPQMPAPTMATSTVAPAGAVDAALRAMLRVKAVAMLLGFGEINSPYYPEED